MKKRVFFYGTFMSADVLAGYDAFPESVEPAKLDGYALSIGPRANVTRAAGSVVYGAVALLDPEELAGIYARLERDHGLVYEPEEVIVETVAGDRHTALCYATPVMEPGPADAAYVRELAACVRAHGLPESYALEVESFAP